MTDENSAMGWPEACPKSGENVTALLRDLRCIVIPDVVRTLLFITMPDGLVMREG